MSASTRRSSSRKLVSAGATTESDKDAGSDQPLDLSCKPLDLSCKSKKPPKPQKQSPLPFVTPIIWNPIIWLPIKKRQKRATKPPSTIKRAGRTACKPIRKRGDKKEEPEQRVCTFSTTSFSVANASSSEGEIGTSSGSQSTKRSLSDTERQALAVEEHFRRSLGTPLYESLLCREEMPPEEPDTTFYEDLKTEVPEAEELPAPKRPRWL